MDGFAFLCTGDLSQIGRADSGFLVLTKPLLMRSKIARNICQQLEWIFVVLAASVLQPGAHLSLSTHGLTQLIRRCIMSLFH